MKRYKPYFEDITLPLSKGTEILYGKFKNKRGIISDIKQDEKGDYLITLDSGKKITMMKIRLIQENLRLVDLSKHVGLSDFTKKWKQDRLKKKGSGVKSSKLIKMKVNRKSDYISFIFLSEPTYTFNTQIVKLKTADKSMKKDNLYTEEIRFANVFSLLKTNPNFKNFKTVTIEEIKEVLKNCDIFLSCDCGSFWYQGFDYYLTILDAAIVPCTIEPERWDKIHNAGDSIVCKHISLIVAQQKFYLNNMSSMLYKYLQK